MGNNFAKTVKCEVDQTVISPPPLFDPTVTKMSPSSSVPHAGGEVNQLFKDNPGTMDEFHKRCKEILPIPVQGAKIIINKSLSQQFQVTHNLTMSAIQPSGYRFGSTFIGSMLSPSELSSLMMGDIDPSGNLNAQGFYHFTDALRVKWGAQIMNSKFQGLQTSLDFKANTYTVSGCVINPSIATESGIAVLQCLKALTPRVAGGVELMYQRSAAIPEGSMVAVTGSLRYNDPLNCVSAFYGQAGGGLYLYRRINDELQVGVEVERIQQQLSASVAYQYDVPKANFTMKGMVDNNWTVTGVFEKRLLPMPCIFALCGSINHIKNQFRMGCQVNLEL